MTPTVGTNPTTTKRLIPLDLLDLAPENPRKEPDPGAIAELAESIAPQGLLQNLVVYWDGERARVVAGGRRLRALKKLAEGGRLPEARGSPRSRLSTEETGFVWRDATCDPNTSTPSHRDPASESP